MATSRAARRELLIVLLTGAAGAALVLLAVRQDWARVVVAEPKPLPASVTRLTGQALVPAATPLAVAALAGLAAVVATRRLLRRLVGILLALFGAAAAAGLSAGITAAGMLAAAAGSAGPATGAGASSGAGSTTSGGGSGAAAPIAGFPSHAALTALPWRPVAIAGAVLVVAAGLVAAWRAERLPVMSARYDAPQHAPAGRGEDRDLAAPPPGSPRARPDPAAGGGAPRGDSTAGADRAADRDSASLWESLSRGEDPTTPGEDTPSRAGAEPERR